MNRSIVVVLALLAATPALGAAQQQQQQQPTPADSVRAGTLRQWAGRGQFVPRMWMGRPWRVAPGRFGPGAWAGPRAQAWARGWGGGLGPGAWAPGAHGRFAQPGGFGLLGPGMRQYLGVTEEQAERLDAIRDEVRASVEKQHKQALERMRNVLTAEQRQKLDELRQRWTGAPPQR